MFDAKFSGHTDWPALKQKFKHGVKNPLTRAGAFVRRTAKGSIKPAGKKGKSAKPGQPPRSHTKRLKDLIFFAYQPEESSVIIGPLLFKVASPTVPRVLELGGTVTRRVRVKPAKAARPASAKQKTAYRAKLLSGAIKRAAPVYVQKTQTYHQFPYMTPAIKKEAPKFPQLFTNCVK